MPKTFKSKVFVNKTNHQISVNVPRRKIKLFKDKTPKKIKFEIKEIEW